MYLSFKKQLKVCLIEVFFLTLIKKFKLILNMFFYLCVLCEILIKTIIFNVSGTNIFENEKRQEIK